MKFEGCLDVMVPSVMAILFIVHFTYRNDCSGGLCCVVFHFVLIEGAVEVLFGIPVAYAVFALFP